MAHSRVWPLELTGTDGHHYRIFPEDILYLTAENVYCRLTCVRYTLRVRHPMIQLQELLPKHFLRVHRSYLINPDYVIKLYPRTVLMSNGARLPVPIRRHAWLQACLATGRPGSGHEEGAGYLPYYPDLHKNEGDPPASS